MKALVRFVGLGAALFAVLSWAPLRHPRAGGDPSRSLHADESSDEILLLTAALDHMLDEADVIVQRRLTENARVLQLADAYGDAVRLRLGDGDPIVERRLVQQMRLQLEGEARHDEPTEAQLREYLAGHTDRFIIPERVRIHHIFYSVARRGARAEQDARRVGIAHPTGLGNPDGGQCPPYDHADAEGDPSLWPAELPLQSAVDLEKIFGAATAAIVAAPLHAWTGPHRSALGYHLTTVVERAPAAMPPFETVRAAVRLAWLNERAEQHVRQTLTALR